jgi:hypothetical protein
MRPIYIRVYVLSVPPKKFLTEVEASYLGTKLIKEVSFLGSILHSQV